MSKPLQCIVCNMTPDAAFAEHDEKLAQQPWGATEFVSGGHYGSTVFDPMDSSYLIINICDQCLTDKSRYPKTSVVEVPMEPDGKHGKQRYWRNDH